MSTTSSELQHLACNNTVVRPALGHIGFVFPSTDTIVGVRKKRTIGLHLHSSSMQRGHTFSVYNKRKGSIIQQQVGPHPHLSVKKRLIRLA